jgi:hypothetical protein
MACGSETLVPVLCETSCRESAIESRSRRTTTPQCRSSGTRFAFSSFSRKRPTRYRHNNTNSRIQLGPRPPINGELHEDVLRPRSVSSSPARIPCRQLPAVNRISDENNPHREPTVLPDGRHICPFCELLYKNRKTYMVHKLQVHKVVERVCPCMYMYANA